MTNKESLKKAYEKGCKKTEIDYEQKLEPLRKVYTKYRHQTIIVDQHTVNDLWLNIMQTILNIYEGKEDGKRI